MRVRTYGVEHFPTSALRWLSVKLYHSRALAGVWRAVETELLARDLPRIADESGGHLVAPITRVH